MKSLAYKAVLAFASISVVTTIAFAPTAQINRQPAYALPAFETNPKVILPLISIAATQLAMANKETVLDGLAWTVAKVAIDSITKSLVNWINSGFDGSPAFVTDLKENLTYLGDAIADDFIDRLDQNIVANTGFSIRTPFQDQLNAALREEFYRTTASYGLDYTLNAYSEDPKAFIDGEFRRGGFNAFFAASQNPSNNPLGAYLQAQNRLWAEISAAQQQRRQELEWGKGFLSFRGPCPVRGEVADLSRAEKCPFNSVRTPGSVIENQLVQNLGSGVRQLELADNINEIVGALFGQLVNQVLGSGGLASVSQPAAGGGRSYLDRATDGTGVSAGASSLARGALNNIDIDRRRLERYQRDLNDMQEIMLSLPEKCRQDAQSIVQISDIMSELNNTSAALDELDRLEQGIERAVGESNTDSTAVTRAVTAYQNFLSSPNVPSSEQTAGAASALIELQDRAEELRQSCRS